MKELSGTAATLNLLLSPCHYICLHNVYEASKEDEQCQITAYIVQLLWRDLSSNFEVIHFYNNCL